MQDGTLLAAVDLGSNSFRLEIGRYEHGHIQRVEYLKETVRQGSGLDEERNLGVTCMAVAIPAGGPPGVALSVSAPSAELAGPDRERLLPVLRAAAAGLAALPGFDHALAALRPPDAGPPPRGSDVGA